MNTIGGAQRQDVPRHTDTDQVALASDTDDGGDDSSDESFDYDYSDGGLISEPGGGVQEDAFVHTEIRRPYTNVFRNRARDSETLRIYGHTRRPFAGPGALVVQIEERRAELAFLRAAWPRGATRPIDHEVTPSPPVLPPQPSQWQPHPGSSPWRHVPPRAGNAGIAPEGGDESEPDDGGALMTTVCVQRPPPVPLGRSGNEHAANLPHDGDHAMEGGNAAARHAAERTAADTEDGAAVRDEGASSTTVSCGARLGGALDVAGETTTRTGGETLGEVGSQGVVPTPMTDTGTAGTSECEVRADACGAEGRGMDASEGFVVFRRAAASDLGAHGMVTDGPGEAATGGGGNTGPNAVATRACATGEAAVGSGGGAGAEVADEGASSTTDRGMKEEAHSGGACDGAKTDMVDKGTVADDSAGARATAVGIGSASGDATDDHDGGGETEIVGEGAQAVTTYAGGATIDDTPVALAPAGGKKKRRRARSSSRP